MWKFVLAALIALGASTYTRGANADITVMVHNASSATMRLSNVSHVGGQWATAPGIEEGGPYHVYSYPPAAIEPGAWVIFGTQSGSGVSGDGAHVEYTMDVPNTDPNTDFFWPQVPSDVLVLDWNDPRFGSPSLGHWEQSGPGPVHEWCETFEGSGANDATEQNVWQLVAVDGACPPIADGFAITTNVFPSSPPLPGPAATNDRFWHDASGNVFHEDTFGAVTAILDSSSTTTQFVGSVKASSSIAGYSYPISGETAWFLDSGSPPHLRQIFLPANGAPVLTDWGSAPGAQCAWVKNPAVASPYEGRAELFVDALCDNSLRLYRRTWDSLAGDTGWMIVTPPATPEGYVLASSPAVAISRYTNRMDVVAMSDHATLLHGSCAPYFLCDGGATMHWDEAPTPRVMCLPGGCDGWAGDPALAVAAPGVIRAFSVTSKGNLSYREWAESTSAWTAPSLWYSPSVPCSAAGDGPAAVGTDIDDVFVGCTTKTGLLFGGWGNTALSTNWWQLAGGVSGGAALTAH